MMDFIERLRAKPEHIRHRIALGASSGFTAVIAIAWMVALVSSDTLTLSPAPAEQDPNIASAMTDGKDSVTSLLGAAGGAFGLDNGEPDITVVETRASSTLDQPAETEATVIPF